MQHRTQLYLDEDQYSWLKRQAGSRGSIAGVVRQLIDRARTAQASGSTRDPLIRYLLDEPAGQGADESTVETLDRDLYG